MVHHSAVSTKAQRREVCSPSLATTRPIPNPVFCRVVPQDLPNQETPQCVSPPPSSPAVLKRLPWLLGGRRVLPPGALPDAVNGMGVLVLG